jgi:Short C-terminal domain
MLMRRRPLMRTAATTAVVAGTATAVSGRVARRQNAKAQQAAEAQASEMQQAPVAPPPPVPSLHAAPAGLSDQSLDQLTKLAALHEQGVLTDEEFAAQKAKILG